jgi:hypothetical protein
LGGKKDTTLWRVESRERSKRGEESEGARKDGKIERWKVVMLRIYIMRILSSWLQS